MDARELEKLEKRMKRRQADHDLGKWKFVMVYGWGLFGLIFLIGDIRELMRHELSLGNFLILLPVLFLSSTLFGLFLWACAEGEYADTRQDYEHAKKIMDGNK